MRIAHLSELHLGHEAFEATEEGRNVRERDVARALEFALERVVALKPEVVALVGDIFDRWDPAAAAMQVFLDGLRGIQKLLPDARVMVVGGGRDLPAGSVGPPPLSILPLPLGVHVAVDRVQTVTDAELGTRVVLAPSGTGEVLAELEPDPNFQWNILLAYLDDPASKKDIDTSSWSYVGFGGHHSCTEDLSVGTGHFPGALERVGEGPWAEAGEEKGFLFADLVSGEREFVAVPGRPVVALAPISNRGRSREWLVRRVKEVLREVPGGIDGKIVRLQTEGFSPEDIGALPTALLSSARNRALHLTFEVWRSRDETDLEGFPALLSEGTGASPPLTSLLQTAMDNSAAGGRYAGGFTTVRAGPFSPLSGLDLDLPDGVTGILGGNARTRAEMRSLLRAALVDDPSDPRQNLTQALQMNEGSVSLEELFRQVTRALRDFLDQRFEIGIYQEPRDTSAIEVDRPASELDELLTALRADAAEGAGEVEVATMEWIRERQDAETRLQAYRDRARELKGRMSEMEEGGVEFPCPTCSRSLGDEQARVLEALREEWEEIVQDGQWWNRRRAQLEVKPDRLQSLEGATLKLHAEMEELAERVEVARAVGSPELGDRPHTQSAPSEVAREFFEVLSGRLSHLWSDEYQRLGGGRAHSISTGAKVILLEEGVPLTPSAEEVAAARVALQLAVLSFLEEFDAQPEGLLVSPAFDSMERPGRIRAIRRYRMLRPSPLKTTVVTEGDWVGWAPEILDAGFRICRDQNGAGQTLERFQLPG